MNRNQRIEVYTKALKDNEATCKITSFNDCIVDQLIPSTTILKKNGESIEIATDYLLE